MNWEGNPSKSQTSSPPGVSLDFFVRPQLQWSGFLQWSELDFSQVTLVQMQPLLSPEAGLIIHHPLNLKSFAFAKCLLIEHTSDTIVFWSFLICICTILCSTLLQYNCTYSVKQQQCLLPQGERSSSHKGQSPTLDLGKAQSLGGGGGGEGHSHERGRGHSVMTPALACRRRA